MPNQKDIPYGPLSSRLRPDVECAPWVIEEVRKLEAALNQQAELPAVAVSDDDLIGHPRSETDTRDEIELFLRDAFAAGCHAAQSRSLLLAITYAHREAPKLRAALAQNAQGEAVTDGPSDSDVERACHRYYNAGFAVALPRPEAMRAALTTYHKRLHAERARVPAVVREVMDELEKAIRKFPTWPNDPLHAVGVFNEEAGELSKAVLQQVYEPHKNQPGDVRKEARQAAAMALRFLVSLDTYEWLPSVQHDQPAFAEGAKA